MRRLLWALLCSSYFCLFCEGGEQEIGVFRKLGDIRVNSITFTKTPVRTALKYVQYQLAHIKNAPLHLNFVYCFPLGKGEPVVTHEMQDVSVREGLALLCQKSDLVMKANANTIAFYPKGMDQREVFVVNEDKVSQQMYRKLRKIIVPRFSYQATNSSEVLGEVLFLPDIPPELNVDLAVERPSLLVLEGSSIPLVDFLKYICECKGWKCELKGNVLSIGKVGPEVQSVSIEVSFSADKADKADEELDGGSWMDGRHR